MNKNRIITTVVLTIVLTMLLAFGVSAETQVEPHWIDNGDGTWSYMESDGQLVKSELDYWIGGYCYGFDANGIMYTGWVQPYRYDLEYIDYADGWRNTWYYFESNGHAPAYGYHAETGYLFYSNGQVNENGFATMWDEETQTSLIYVSDDKGVATRVENTGWNLVNGKWHYVQEDENGDVELLYYGIHELDGVEYYFRNGALAPNCFAWDSENGVRFYSDDGGHPVYEGWIRHNDAWYYIQDGETLYGGIYTIGENQYYFDWNGEMAENENISGSYGQYAGPGGALLVDTWLCNDYGWRYYKEDGVPVIRGWYTIGEVDYYFSDGYLLEDCVQNIRVYDEELEDYVYRWYQFTSGGSYTLIEDGWVYDEHYYGGWMYFVDGEPVCDCIYTVDGKNYVFDWYVMVEEEDVRYAYWDKVGRYVALHVNADGTVNETTGWKQLDGSWYFGQEDGTLRQGWTYSDGAWYYLAPYMYKNTIATVGGRTYYFDSEGRSSDFCADGLKLVDTAEVYYYEYGTPVHGWRQIDGNWYYFGYHMYTDGRYHIGEDYYYFDANGIMQTGWIQGDYERYYADENGHLVTGLQEIDGETYIFDGWGYLVTECTWDVDDVEYLLDEDGKVVAKNTDEPGWIYHNGKWYYLDEDGWFYRYGHYTIDDKQYYFEDYTMVSDRIVYNRYYGPDGARVTGGWINYNGNWYYAWEEQNGYLYNYGLCYIDDSDNEIDDGSYYYFENGVLCVGSFVYGNDILVTDESGRVVALQPFQEGWNLVNHFGHGAYYYIQNGELYLGWLGDYYLSDDGMCSGAVEWIDDTCYYFHDNGRVARNEWVYLEFYDLWLYAKESGELYRNEWALIGDTWYYFDGAVMVEDCNYWIDGKWHVFAEGGAWLGEATEEPTDYVLADGWQELYGETHYVQYGEPITYGICNIDGVWYGFDYDGLVKNDFNDEGYYMDGNGVVVPYTGWQMINGKWCYFTPEHRLAEGWFKVGDVQYYGEDDGIATGYVVDNWKLHYFDESGAYQGEVTADGWYADGDTWFYVLNGEVADGLVTIGGVDYYFMYGEMRTDSLAYDYENYDYVLVGSNGARITAEGWYKMYDLWFYVDAQGYLCTGTHIIGGTTYCFNYLNYIFY